MTGRQTDLDRLYGLEPVIEPGDASGSDAIESFIEVSCPWCCEPTGLCIDLTAGDQSCIEDCQVCCQPIQMEVRIAADGTLGEVTAERAGR
jgi:hypothetical protein